VQEGRELSPLAVTARAHRSHGAVVEAGDGGVHEREGRRTGNAGPGPHDDMSSREVVMDEAEAFEVLIGVGEGLPVGNPQLERELLVRAKAADVARDVVEGHEPIGADVVPGAEHDLVATAVRDRGTNDERAAAQCRGRCDMRVVRRHTGERGVDVAQHADRGRRVPGPAVDGHHERSPPVEALAVTDGVLGRTGGGADRR